MGGKKSVALLSLSLFPFSMHTAEGGNSAVILTWTGVNEICLSQKGWIRPKVLTTAM